MDIELLKEIPGYKAILKAVLKSQIQMLVEQLSAQTEEESVLLTVSLTDGSLHHLGSMSGKDFLEGREEIKSQFLFHCLNRKTRSPVPNQDQVFMPHLSSPMPRVTSPLQHVTSPSASGQYSPESRPAKKPRRTLPLPTGRGRGRKPQSQINAGARNIPRPRVSAPATITRPPEEPDTTGYTAGETEKAPEPDLITVKAEDFELNIDLNDSATKPNEAPVDNVISDIMNIVNQPLKSVPVPASSTQSFASDQGDLDMSASTGDVKDSNTSLSGMEGDSSLNLKESIVPVKIEAPDDDLEITGSEPGAAQAMYMVAGSSGTMGSQSWAPMGTVGMESESFTSGAEGQDEESFDFGNQTSGKYVGGRQYKEKSIKDKGSKPAPKSKAQRTAECRARKKARMGVEAYNEIEKLRKRRSYVKAADLTPRELEKRRRINRERIQRYRKRLKEEARQKK